MNHHDNWLKSAINNTESVAQILLKLRHSSPSPPKTWTVRQRRSRPPPPPPSAAKKSSSTTTRASPTTPLSYSGATSVSGDGVEQSSQPLHHNSDISRSIKVIQTNDTTPTKRPRRKKTLPELKEDETALLKERKQLKRQLATLQATCQEQRMENERLKKMKNDMKSQVTLGVSGCTEEERNENFVVPDLNIPAGEDL
ncbi:hypothetical protein QVD17_02569 [Tagetes erecta]|uniref:Uncharacterized protein n=1 Tax=Tagetes erecta TaxID=13708 RepID=A0AAD8P9A7_TARER|nr:hypothetical protein QVD17_02569 [Tagetes erecta]